jgi:malate synthase
MDDGKPVTVKLVEQVIANELGKAKTVVDEKRFSAYQRAADLMRELVKSPKFMDFLTLPAYDRVMAEGL